MNRLFKYLEKDHSRPDDLTLIKPIFFTFGSIEGMEIGTGGDVRRVGEGGSASLTTWHHTPPPLLLENVQNLVIFQCFFFVVRTPTFGARTESGVRIPSPESSGEMTLRQSWIRMNAIDMLLWKKTKTFLRFRKTGNFN